MIDRSAPGRAAACIAAAGGLVMAGALAHGLLSGDLAGQAAAIAGATRGRILIADIYVGIALFAGWIVWREAPLAAVVWVAALATLGNVVACIYVLRALRQARGSARRFWNGRRMRPRRRQAKRTPLRCDPM